METKGLYFDLGAGSVTIDKLIRSKDYSLETQEKVKNIRNSIKVSIVFFSN